MYFSVLVRSPLFVKFMVQINERTKIDISLNAFETMEHKMIASHSRHRSQMPQLIKGSVGGGIASHFRKGPEDAAGQPRTREDSDAQIEVLKNTKAFLTEKVKKNEEVIKALQGDVDILKNYLRIEKSVNQKTKAQLSQKEKELEDLRREFLDKEQDQRLKINELAARTAEKDRTLEELQAKKKTLKGHKKVLKDEILRLRKELNEAEVRAHNKTVALKSLADFFNNQTLAKVRQMNPDLLEND